MDDRLYRSRTDRMIAGVAGGLAERYDIDPALVRIAWALLILGTGGMFFLLYIVMAIVVPEDPLGAATPAAPMSAEAPTANIVPPADTTGTGSSADAAAVTTGPDLTAAAAAAPVSAPAMSAREARRAARGGRRNSNAPMIFGAVLVIIGALAFAGQVFPQLDFDLIWPIGLIVLGAALVLGATRRSS